MKVQTSWDEILQDIKNRGVENVELFVTDGLAGIKDVIFKNFPSTKFQRCWTHISRNISTKVKPSDNFEIIQDLKLIYNQTDEEQAIQKFNSFLNKWNKKYPNITRGLLKIADDLFAFYSFPYAIRKSIYTTNLIEALNSQIKRQLKGKKQFSTVEAAEKILVAMFEEYNFKNSQYKHCKIKRWHSTKGKVELSSFWFLL
ncbi:IS256 family transposase [Mycoplasma aquilae ATCC BAA-1896]|uniref:IS256 family transposase n=1 Tax=Mycoplasma aquilae TaxID=1312741 RepID=UPI003A8A9806